MGVQSKMKTGLIRQACLDSVRHDKPFPEVVQVLREAGVERYHADLVRHEMTYYDDEGEVFTVRPDYHLSSAVPASADLAKVRAAIAAIQQRQIGYVEFLRLILAAGIVEYFVFLAGRRAVYVGRQGDSHVEWFPPALG